MTIREAAAAVRDRVRRVQDVFLNPAGSAFGISYSRTHRSAMLFENVIVGLRPMGRDIGPNWTGWHSNSRNAGFCWRSLAHP